MFELRRELDQTGQDFLSIKAIDGIVTSVNQVRLHHPSFSWQAKPQCLMLTLLQGFKE